MHMLRCSARACAQRTHLSQENDTAREKAREAGLHSLVALQLLVNVCCHSCDEHLRRLDLRESMHEGSNVREHDRGHLFVE